MPDDHDPLPNLDGIELRQMRYFLAVADDLNFTKAAEGLHLAQQALSASIRRLEEQLGVALFVRSTRKVELTVAGEVFVEGARAVVAVAADAIERVHQVAEGRRGRLTIGFSTAAGGVAIVRRIIRTFAEQAPAVDVRTVEHDFADPTAGLADGSVDTAFIFGPLPVDGLHSMPLATEARLLAVRPEHPMAARSSVTRADLDGLPWLRVPAEPGPWTDFWFPDPHPGPSAPTIRTADEWVTAIEAGRGVAYTMPVVMANFPTARITVVPIEGLSPAEVLLAWPAGSPDPLVHALLRIAQEEVDKVGQPTR